MMKTISLLGKYHTSINVDEAQLKNMTLYPSIHFVPNVLKKLRAWCNIHQSWQRSVLQQEPKLRANCVTSTVLKMSNIKCPSKIHNCPSLWLTGWASEWLSEWISELLWTPGDCWVDKGLQLTISLGPGLQATIASSKQKLLQPQYPLKDHSPLCVYLV